MLINNAKNSDRLNKEYGGWKWFQHPIQLTISVSFIKSRDFQLRIVADI